METSPLTSGSRQIPPSLGYSSAALALWIFRRPILALVGFIFSLALTLAKPALLVLGILKIADLLQPPRDATATYVPPQPIHPGDDEALLVPARALSPSTQSATTGLEV